MSKKNWKIRPHKLWPYEQLPRVKAKIGDDFKSLITEIENIVKTEKMFISTKFPNILPLKFAFPISLFTFIAGISILQTALG